MGLQFSNFSAQQNPLEGSFKHGAGLHPLHLSFSWSETGPKTWHFYQVASGADADGHGTGVMLPALHISLHASVFPKGTDIPSNTYLLMCVHCTFTPKISKLCHMYYLHLLS